MKLLDPDDPFFRPLWIRLATTLVPLLWGLFEFATGAAFWGVLFVAVGLWCGYVLFIKKNEGGR